MGFRISVLIATMLGFAAFSARGAETPTLAHEPTLSRTHIVFVWSGYLWSVPREGGEAIQLTTGGHEDHPVFSPDGKWIAFTGQYDGNTDVYVMPAEGGAPRRLTWHPNPDIVEGWTPDSKQVLFRSRRDSYAFFERLYTVPVEGGWPQVLPMWRGEEAWFSPDGKSIAYVPNFRWQIAWKHYHGGQNLPIYVVRLSDLALEKIPFSNSHDSDPVWFGNTVYFLSDRNGPVTLFAYDTKAKAVKQVIENKGLDFKHVSAGPDELVYEQFGGIYLFDPGTGKSSKVDIYVTGDLPATRPHYEKVAEKIENAEISPTGARAVFEARGDILTVPAEKGDVRNITRTTAAAERDPSWAPDGKWIAYFSDESGEYELYIRDQSGIGAVKKINLGNPPSFFHKPTWSSDSKKIAYTDERLNLWYVDIDKGVPVKVDTDPFGGIDLANWSPDSRWLTYSKHLQNHWHAVFVYSLDAAKITQITNSMSDAKYPVFDKGGKELFFADSTDLGLSGSNDLSSFQHPILRNIYAVLLKKGDASPVEPQSDDEKIAGEKEKKDEAASADNKDTDNSKKDDQKSAEEKKKEAPVKVTIDFEGIDQRIVALPIRAGNYTGLYPGKAGALFLEEIADVPRLDEQPSGSVSKFDLKTRKTEPFIAHANGFWLSANGEKAMYRQGKEWFIVATNAAAKPGEGGLEKMEDMQVYVDPRAEWNQMYHEVWRIERDFFYDPNYHGLNLEATEKEYAPYLKGVGGREDLNYLFNEMLGNLTVGHMFIHGGDIPEANQVKGGLLGADYKIENGHYRFVRIYNGENWNPDLRAPLTQPGQEVKAGEYLLEVNGEEVRPPADVNQFLENTAGEQIRIKVGPNPNEKDAREITVIPVDNEFTLRNRAWQEDNRRKVDELSGGKIAYVHLPDTTVGGYTNFNRFYFAQVGKQAAIIDERYNDGGQIADYIIDELERPLRMCAISRNGGKDCSPMEQIYGPKTMIANEEAGSGGDALPWMFKQDKVGTLVGTRTWGGLVGIGGYPVLIDGGTVTAPSGAIYGLHGSWEVENHGIAPDIEVENDPASVAAGHDPQLEKAVEITLEKLKEHPVVIPDHPPYPNYYQK